MMLDFFATFFSSARTMLPLVAGQILKVGAQGYGLLCHGRRGRRADRGCGPLAAPRHLSPGRRAAEQRRALRRRHRVLWPLDQLCAQLSALHGYRRRDTVSTVIRQTIRQSITPDRLRGRMTGINQIFFMGGPQLGELEAGIVASIFGVPFAIVSGGIATVALTALIAWRYPRLRTYTRDTMIEDEARMAEGAVA